MDENSSKGVAEQALFAGEAWFDPIEAGLRGRIRGLIEELVEQELEVALGRGRYERAGGAVGHRHGSRKRRLTGSFGPVEIAVPRARLRGEDGTTREWRSAALPRYARRTRQVEALIAGAYLAGTNTRRVQRALAALFRGRGRQGRRQPHLAQAEDRLGGLVPTRPGRRGRGPADP